MKWLLLSLEKWWRKSRKRYKSSSLSEANWLLIPTFLRKRADFGAELLEELEELLGLALCELAEVLHVELDGLEQVLGRVREGRLKSKLTKVLTSCR